MLRIRDVHNGVVRDMSTDADVYSCRAGACLPPIMVIRKRLPDTDSLMDYDLDIILMKNSHALYKHSKRILSLLPWMLPLSSLVRSIAEKRYTLSEILPQ